MVFSCMTVFSSIFAATCAKCKSPISSGKESKAETTSPEGKNKSAGSTEGSTTSPPRPRDSPNRYDFRQVPKVPLISENADSEGLLVAPAPAQGHQQQAKNGVPVALQDLTMAAFAFSPSAAPPGRLAKKLDQNDANGGVNSPMTGGNLMAEK